MVPSVTHRVDISPFSNVEKAANNDIFDRVWIAVYNIFAALAAAIHSALSDLRTSIQTKIGIGESWTQRYDREFLQKAIDSARRSLSKNGKDAIDEFNSDLECCMPDALQKAINASVRYIIFSDSDFCPTYLIGHEEKIKDHRVRGDHTIITFVEYRGEIELLKALYLSLDEESQRIIFDHFAPDDIEAMNLCDQGKDILRRISEFSLKLVQNNPAFDRAFRNIH